MRVERFELITKLILSQPPLPIGLHARGISDFGFRIADLFVLTGKELVLSEPVVAVSLNPQFEIRNPKFFLVPAEGFEPTLSSS